MDLRLRKTYLDGMQERNRLSEEKTPTVHSIPFYSLTKTGLRRSYGTYTFPYR